MKQSVRKRGILIAACAVVLLAGIGAGLWYFRPTRLCSAKPGEVSSITVFDGNTGNLREFTSEEEIAELMEMWNGTEIEKSQEITEPMSGIKFDVKISLDSGEEIRFDIGSPDSLRKTDGSKDYFWAVTKGDNGFDYLETALNG